MGRKSKTNKEGERGKTDRERERKKERERKWRFSHLFDGRNSTVREENLIHALRATRGYKNLGVSSNSVR